MIFDCGLKTTNQKSSINRSMLLGRVLGSAVCTLKYPNLEGVKLLTVQPLNRHLQPVGRLQVAADVVDAGPGDVVVLVRAREAAMALPGEKFVPIDLTCVGVVDDLELPPMPAALLKVGPQAYA
jgi:ethanolamine utilization protein EutN